LNYEKVVIYLLSGEQYIDEARRSTQSIKHYHNDLPCILCTPDKVTNTQPFDDILVLPEKEHKFFYVDATKWWYQAVDKIDAKHFLLLDCDTYALSPLNDFFDILGRFDFTGVHSVGRQTMLQRDDIPISFPELHIGANSFVKSKKVVQFLSDFYELYASKAEYFGNNDQGPLREALWINPQIRLNVLTPEFCFRYRWGGLISGDVKLLHGHEHGTPYEQIAKEIKSKKGIRIYHKRELA